VLDQRLAPSQLLGMALVVAASALVLGLGARKDPAESTGA
jgi:inner membrane transporter RhtA